MSDSPKKGMFKQKNMEKVSSVQSLTIHIPKDYYEEPPSHQEKDFLKYQNNDGGTGNSYTLNVGSP